MKNDDIKGLANLEDTMNKEGNRRMIIIVLNFLVLAGAAYGVNLMGVSFGEYNKYIIGIPLLIIAIGVSGYLFIFKDLANK